jgi:hypothetical protein
MILCVMFEFQLGSLHIFKDVTYYAKKIYVSSSVYKVPTTTTQGKQWVVSFRWYKVIGDNMPNHYQETILTLIIVTYVVKTMIVGRNMKQEIENIHIDL